jgi:IS30 family transposase
MVNHNAEPMTLSRHARRDLAWQLRHQQGWTLARIGRRLGVKTPAVSRLLRRAAMQEMRPAETGSAPRRIAARRVRAVSLSSVFHV